METKNPNLPPPWDSAITLEPGKSVYMDKDIASDYEKQRKALREIRGNVLAHTMEIEFLLDRLLTELFLNGVSNEQHKLTFNSVVFKQSRLALSKKIEFLERFIKTLENSAEFKEVIKNLKQISEVRNDFAHNLVSFYPGEDGKLRPFIVHFDGNKDALNNDYFNRLNQLYSSTSTQIENLIKKLTSNGEIKG